MDYPPTRRDDVTEVMHGVAVSDPYRWLEDPDAPDTQEWVRAQNALSGSYLAGLPDRPWFAAAMRAIVERPRTGVPFTRGGRVFVTRNDGRQNQDVWYVADTLDELLAGGRVLLDPNTFSADGTDSVGSFTVSPNGELACYGRCVGGSDWQTFVILDIATGAPLDDPQDAVIETKFCEAAWLPDSRSYVYTDFAHDGPADGTQTGAVRGGTLRLHRLGQAQADDRVLAAFPENPLLMPYAEVSADGRFVVLGIVEGTENRNRLWLFPVHDGPVSTIGEPLRLIDEPVAEFGFVGIEGDRVLLQTDLRAPRGRVVSCELGLFDRTGLAEFVDVVAESTQTLESVVAAGDGFVVAGLEDAAPRLAWYALDGSSRCDLDVTGGALVGVTGEQGEADAFIGLSSVTTPTAVFHLDTGTGVVRPLPELAAGGVAGEAAGFSPPAVHVARRRATSRDGTSVPYFLIEPEGAAGAPRPVLVWGYGGFKIPLLAEYRHGWSAWLAAGGSLVVANLRGGGEFGTDWYEQGRLAHKQNVFDDLYAVAEDLVASGITTSPQLALHGRSNGGLLAGAALTQRPDLFAAVIPGVGVLDMLRYHLFTIGAAWMSDYPDPDDPEQFAVALAYSPLHNIRPQTAYPATLVLTGDHDDRVVPLHSHKFVATLQRAQAGPAPILARIEVATGHGVGKPSAMVAAEWADLLAFAAHHTGLRPPSVGSTS